MTAVSAFFHGTSFDVSERYTQALHGRHRLLCAIGHRTQLWTQRWHPDSRESVECYSCAVHFQRCVVNGGCGRLRLCKNRCKFGVDALAERGNESAIDLRMLAPQLCRRIVLISERLPRGCHIAIRVTISAIDILPEQSW